MVDIPLRIGPLSLPGHVMARSGIRWLVPDGHLCRPGEAIAYCNVGLSAGRFDLKDFPFASERRDLQAVFAPGVGGRLRQAQGASLGGALDELQTFRWDANDTIGAMEISGAALTEAGVLRLMMLAGRRMTELAEVRSGLLTGWHDRKRAWWGDGPVGTLIALATCEQTGILGGRGGGFLELFASVAGPAHIVLVQDEPLVPCTRVLLEGMKRTPAQHEAIAADLARTFAAGVTCPEPADWLFAGALARGLVRSPLTEAMPLLGRSGPTRAAPAAAVLISLAAEFLVVWRHRALGYTLACHEWRLAEAGPATRAWLRGHFEPVRRSIEDVRGDFLALLAQLRATTGSRVLVLTLNTTPAYEQITTYAGFNHPLGESLGSVRSKELALMLADLSRDHALDVVDTDLLVAELGLRTHMPDGTHHSGRLQAALRDEVLRILRVRGVIGFNAR